MLVEYPFIGDAIHIKIGGDHGGGSFKLVYQICNTRNPNSLANTVVIEMCQAKDYHENLGTGIIRYRDQVVTLEQTTYK